MIPDDSHATVWSEVDVVQWHRKCANQSDKTNKQKLDPNTRKAHHCSLHPIVSFGAKEHHACYETGIMVLMPKKSQTEWHAVCSTIQKWRILTEEIWSPKAWMQCSCLELSQFLAAKAQNNMLSVPTCRSEESRQKRFGLQAKVWVQCCLE